MVRRVLSKVKGKLRAAESSSGQESDEDRLIFYGLLVALAVTVVFAGYAVWRAQQPTPFSQVWLEESSLPSSFVIILALVPDVLKNFPPSKGCFSRLYTDVPLGASFN